MGQTRSINYKSDFVLRERFRDGAGRLTALPAVDFELRYWTHWGKEYVARREGDTYTNCQLDGDALLVIFKDHGLTEGALKHELHLRLDNALMPDGVQNIYYPEQLDISLTQMRGSEEGILECDTMAAYTRGYPFTWEDFTPAQILTLQQPATEAAERADAATQEAERATREADAATAASMTQTGKAKTATQEAERATREADAATAASTIQTGKAKTATQEAERATREADAATAASTTQTGKAKTATDYANQAGQQAAGEAERVAAVREELESAVARAELVVAGVPTGLRVTAPDSVTLGNMAKQYVCAQVLPYGVAQNVIFQTDGDSVLVEPDGEILARREGVSRVHVIPTEGTKYYKTLRIEVTRPRLLIGGGLLLDTDGGILLT